MRETNIYNYIGCLLSEVNNNFADNDGVLYRKAVFFQRLTMGILMLSFVVKLVGHYSEYPLSEVSL